jgi:hypothetical protein
MRDLRRRTSLDEDRPHPPRLENMRQHLIRHIVCINLERPVHGERVGLPTAPEDATVAA